MYCPFLQQFQPSPLFSQMQPCPLLPQGPATCSTGLMYGSTHGGGPIILLTFGSFTSPTQTPPPTASPIYPLPDAESGLTESRRLPLPPGAPFPQKAASSEEVAPKSAASEQKIFLPKAASVHVQQVVPGPASPAEQRIILPKAPPVHVEQAVPGSAVASGQKFILPKAPSPQVGPQARPGPILSPGQKIVLPKAAPAQIQEPPGQRSVRPQAPPPQVAPQRQGVAPAALSPGQRIVLPKAPSPRVSPQVQGAAAAPMSPGQRNVPTRASYVAPQQIQASPRAMQASPYQRDVPAEDTFRSLEESERSRSRTQDSIVSLKEASQGASPGSYEFIQPQPFQRFDPADDTFHSLEESERSSSRSPHESMVSPGQSPGSYESIQPHSPQRSVPAEGGFRIFEDSDEKSKSRSKSRTPHDTMVSLEEASRGSSPGSFQLKTPPPYQRIVPYANDFPSFEESPERSRPRTPYDTMVSLEEASPTQSFGEATVLSRAPSPRVPPQQTVPDPRFDRRYTLPERPAAGPASGRRLSLPADYERMQQSPLQRSVPGQDERSRTGTPHETMVSPEEISPRVAEEERRMRAQYKDHMQLFLDNVYAALLLKDRLRQAGERRAELKPAVTDRYIIHKYYVLDNLLKAFAIREELERRGRPMTGEISIRLPYGVKPQPPKPGQDVDIECEIVAHS